MTAVAHRTPREVRRSPNIWDHPDIYEVEMAAFDRDGRVDAALAELMGGAGGRAVDIGCGTGQALPGLARLLGPAGRVVGVEPHPGLAAAAARRTRHLPGVSVRTGTAQHLPLPDASVRLAHARWAYFFGPGCEPGLAEVARVVRRGGLAVVIDNDATTSTFGSWFRRHLPDYDPAAVERFWARQGWTRRPVLTAWRFAQRADLERVVRIELRPEVADAVLAEHTGLEVDYAVNLWWRRY